MNGIIHIDGGSRGNPGPAGVGVVIHNNDTKRPIHEAGYFLGRTTNNVAEYTGLLRSLELARELGITTVDVNSDSQLMVRQLLGEYRVKSADLKPLFEKARNLLSRFDHWQLHHIPREQNARADELANLAMDARRDIIAFADGQPQATTTAPAAARTPSQRNASATSDPDAIWQVTVEDDADTCPAHTPAGHTAALGPTMGDPLLCIHAAAAIFAAGVPNWSASKRKATAHCAVCQRSIRIRRG